jgi:hypothetical protein
MILIYSRASININDLFLYDFIGPGLLPERRRISTIL